MKRTFAIIMAILICCYAIPLSVFANSANNSIKMVGDLDLDGEITDWDGVLLARFLAGWNGEVADLLIFDIDGDGEVTDWDGVMFDRQLAGWSVNTDVGKKLSFNITYSNTKGATNTNPTLLQYGNMEVQLSSLSIPHYSFDGWFAGNTKYDFIPANQNSDLNLTAKWTPVEYSITYNNTKGATNTNPISYTVEHEEITLKDLTLNGYVFLGWYDGNNKVTTIPEGKTGDILLTAKWESIYNITYTNTKGTTNPNPTSYTEDNGIIELCDLTKIGYTFNGWYDGDSKVTHIDSSEKKDITLTANWTANTYTVSFSGEGGTSNQSVVATYGDAMPELQEIPKRRGFEFLGYYNGDGYKYYNADLSSAKKWNLTKNTKLYARWSDIGYQVFTQRNECSNKHTNNYEEVQNYSEYYVVAKETGNYYLQINYQRAICTGREYNRDWLYCHEASVLIYDESGAVYLIDDVYGVNGGKKYEYNLQGFCTGATKPADGYLLGKSIFDMEESLFEISFPVEKGKTYKIIAYNVMYKPGYTLSGYTYPAGTHKDDCSKNNAKYRVLNENGEFVEIFIKDLKHNITYINTEGAKNPNGIYIVENKEWNLLEPTKDGYKFDGWYLNGEKITTLSNVTSDITLEAKWSLIEYTATFYIDNQAVGTTKFSVENYAIYDFPELPQKEHYITSWDYEMALSDISVNIKYTPIEYTITYENIANATNRNALSYNIEETVSLYELSREGCEFLGWFNGNGELVTKIPKGSFGNITLTAKWGNYTDYTIKFIDNKYSYNVKSILYNVDSEKIVLPELNDAKDYYFAGWYCGEIKYTEIPKYSVGNIELTAKWNSKEITFSGGPSASLTSLSGGSCYVQSVTSSKSWDSEYKVWIVSVTITVRCAPHTTASYDIRLSGKSFGSVYISHMGSAYETISRTVTNRYKPGSY